MTGLRPAIAGLRDAIRRRVEETSLRAVADEVGMSFSGLRSFLEGRSPQRRTREMLMRWYYLWSTLRISRGVGHRFHSTSDTPFTRSRTVISLVSDAG